MHNSEIHSFIDPRNVGSMKFTQVKDYEALSKVGIGLPGHQVEKMVDFAMDSFQGTVTTPNINAAVQFLQNWLPGFVNVITAARKIDEIVGIATVGSWDDEQIVQGVLETTGTAVPYGDYNNTPLSSWNANWEIRSVVRFEEGMRVGRLEEARSSRVRINSGQQKREGAALALEIQRNLVGFYGFNNGANNTYGYLNDPNLPSYVGVANPGSGTQWTVKTFLQICADLRTAFAALRTQSQDTIDPSKDAITLAISTNRADYLSVTSDFGVSVWDWLKQYYPGTRVVSVPQLNAANGGANVFYMHADKVNDLSTDDGRTFIQVVPAKFQLLGVQQLAKGYEEAYCNATAGVMLKRPYGVVRYTGI